MDQVLFKKYCLTNYKKSLSGWEKQFEEEYETHIINLVTDIIAEVGISRSTAKKVGIKRLERIKAMSNSAYTVSSLLRILHRDYLDIGDEIIKKIEQTGRPTTSKNEQLVSVKAHEYHTLTEELNVTMRLLINFKKFKKLSQKKYISWNDMVRTLQDISPNNKFLEYLLENKELRNAIAHCSIWYDSGAVYYYPQEIAKEEPKNLTFNDFIKKTRELNHLVLMFFFIITNQI